ncbi:protein ELYS isoform X1 [Lagopus muta]|uniref:protein ELYS isoform X1 n=1 Tax=Lagopus muta TaxID=64668 RepID=UPI00209E7E5D|nr:protein ELYS isoform X1 [Lagopus muta]XP_048792520.1 protein ELYS isoform X1 [Lagopus muta]XP_048792521.1 protein ELYS isoform X1 [Lagopus muta]XP_048792522.1 protein ELYS isoform X1 [Lagopus muta]XP_048792523.1 protein ELYS isoform X1 [Lagopus muta]XP_048792524.1 protein ELYS isoform X1 [Lagopus muta]XP_048792525.1 protein ELYS isoform X1 [Lagopus muta]
MQDLRAQVTSSLLQFPEVTIQALGEDEITLDSVLHGKFSAGRNGLAWLACGPQLEVVNSVTGERLSAYRFSGVNEQPPTVRVVKEFSWQKRTGLLVGLEEAEGSVLCLYDLGISRVVKAVVLPGRVTAIEPIINHGGASVSTQHLHQSLRWLFGVAAVVTDVGHVLLVDLCLDDLSCSQNEIEASDLEVVSGIPAEVPQRREAVTREGRHLCFQVQNPSGTAISTLCYISRSNLLVVGFSDGYLSLWNMKTLKREYHSQLEGGRIPVYAVTFQEPENDPRNCCYLWAVQSTQESEGDVLSLHLLQLAFGDRKRLASGQVMYEGFEYCDERYSLDLTGGAFPLRGQTSNTKLLSCQTVEKFRNHIDREDSVNEVISPDTSVSVFSWQVNTYGQGKPSTYLGVFDINRWYHAQMPDSLRPEEFLHNCPYFALWSLDAVTNVTSPNLILDVLVHERSLSRGVPPSYPPPEQFFNPSTYNFDGTCLLNSGVVHMTCTGFQKETLNFLKESGPSISEAICDSYNRCLVAGLLSPRLVDVQPSSLSQEEQLEAVLSAAVQTSSLELLTGYIKYWTSEEQPSSAASLRFVLEWTWNKVIYTKEEFDQICVPLFDGSCNFIDPQTMQSLQHCQLLFSNLSTVLNCFLTEARELTEKGVTDLTNKQVVTSLISLYAQVVIWFCRSSLLPEGLDDDMHLSRPFYNYPLIQSYYTSHRQKLERLSRGRWDSDCLMIDGMVSQLGEQAEKLWRRDEGGTGKYPPASLHALLDLYLLENIEENYKHAITIYLLLDIMHSFPNKTETSIDSFPTVFAIPWGLVKLIQGFWLLDHNDFENSLALLFHPATIKTVPWQHMRIIQSLMCQGEHRRALRYMQMMNPSMSSSSEVQLFLTVLLSNRCMVEAWSLLQKHSTKLNVEELLKQVYEICQEMGLMEDLLKLPFTDTEQECLEKFLQTNGGTQNREFLLVHHLQRANYIPALQLNHSMKVNLTNDRDPRLRERAVARNSILDQYGKILPRVQRKLALERAKPYRLPSSVFREVSRPKPLSTVAKQVNAGNVHTRATFISNVLSKIGEVWVGNEQKTSFSQCDSPRVAEPPVITHPLPDAELPDAFVGTPITKLSQKCSRLLDLVVRPVPSCSPAQNESWQSPCLPSTSYMESSSLKSNIHGSSSQKKISRASELNLLETPLVVKRAKVLVTSSSASGFAGFTPQSILRSSLRTTPLATPSASPGRSVTPPLRAKEPRISFRDVNSNAKWTVGVTGNEKAQSGASSEHCRGLVEDSWSGSRDKASLFTLSNTEDDPAEMEESLESIPGDGLEKMDVSKENSNVSVKSDQTTLEYHDAKSPSDFEDDVIFIAAKPASSFTEEPADFQEPAKENNEIIEDELFQVEHTHSSEVGKEAGFLEEATPECPTLPKDGKLVFKAAEGVTSWTSREDETVHEEPKITTASEEKDTVTVKNPQLSEFPEADNESVISVLDSEDVIRTRSENRPEERLVDVPEELNLENEAEVNASFPQEEMHNSNNLPKTEEMNVLDEDIAVKAQTSEESPETSPCSELHPTGNLQYNYDTIEQQFAYDLPDNKDGECYAVEGDGELFISQSNFTLVLEGEEGEGEMGDLALADASKAAVTTTDERPVNSLGSTENEEHVTNSVSTVTSDQESQNIAESLPYVPEPIKVAIAENLLDVIKDTRSKEFTSEVVEQSIHESIGKKVTRFRKSKTPLTPVPEAADDESSIHQVEYVVTPRTRARRQLSRTLIIPSADDEQILKTDKPVLFGLSPRRSTRQTKAYETSSLVTVENTQDEQISVIPATPKRRGRKPKQTNLEKVESSQSDGQVLSSSTQSIAVTPRRLRRAKEAASELLEDANEETSLAEGTVTASTTSRRTRGGKTSAGDQETGQSSTDHRIKMAVSPSRGARKLKSSSSPLVENTIMDQELQPGDQPLLPGPAKRGRRIKMSSSDVSENSDLDLSKSSLPQTELKLPITPRRSARKAAQNLSADVESVSVREDLPSGGEVEILDTPRRRTRKVAQAKPERTDTIEKTPEQPNEQSTTPRTTIRSGFRGRKRQLPSILEENTREEVFPEGTDGSPLLLTDINTSGYEETSRTVTDRVRRNRSRKTSMHQDLPVEENESFFFSPPLTKLTKKFKAGKADQHVQDLDPDLSSQFVFSPPLLRSRRKNVSSTPHTVEEPELPTKEEEEIKSIESLGKQKLKRGRPARSKVKKASKTTRKEVSWSPPPVEINFISPFGTPVDEMRSKQKETTDATEKTVRKNKKRLSNFPKPVVRRKML